MRDTGPAIVLKSPHGGKIVLSISREFRTTNNEAEYEALIQGLQLASSVDVYRMQVISV